MRNLLDFLIKYKHWLLFIFLEVISFVLLFRFNGYQGSVFFTSANVVTGKVYQMTNNLTGYFHLKTINSDLVQHNAELSIQLEHLKEAYKKLTADTTVIEQMKQEALMDCRLIKANVINNSTIHANNFITIDKGEADGVQKEMGVVSGSGIVGIVYQTSAHYAVIIPVLNSKSSISCKIRRSDYFGFLKWEGGSPEFAYIKDMPRHSIFVVGDTIVTSGHSAIFPSGVLVGTVDDVGDSNDGLSYSIRVKLFTDFARLNEVRVVERSNIEEQLELEESVVNKER